MYFLTDFKHGNTCLQVVTGNCLVGTSITGGGVWNNFPEVKSCTCKVALKSARWHNSRDRTGVFIDRHWPMVCRGCSRLGSLLRLSVIFWKDSALRGFQSFIRFGPVMLLLIMWSCFLSLTSMYCLVYVLVSMVCLCFKLSKSPFLQFWVSDLCVYVCYPVIYF